VIRGLPAVLLLAGLLLAAGAAEALDIDLESYQQARRAGAVGGVAGRVLAEPTRPNAPARPFVGTTVTLLPRSPGLLGTLESLKRGHGLGPDVQGRRRSAQV
jgi:hypothetical protein